MSSTTTNHDHLDEVLLAATPGKLGELIMERLMEVDKVAYVRFASVYKDFHEVKDFDDFIENLGERN